MKLLKITTFYPSYLKDFYRKRPGLAQKSFSEQKSALDYDAFGWADFWLNALTPLGYEVTEITYNAEAMQRAWAKENTLRNNEVIDLKEIVVAQVKKFQPEILWFDDSDTSLLERIRIEVPSIRLVLGWAGSAVTKTDAWRHMDLILSCAPESVEYFQKMGLNAEHLHHAFDPRINARLIGRQKQVDFSFIGQVVRYSEFHLLRDKLLEQLAIMAGIAIYSPSADFTWKDEARIFLTAGVYDGFQRLRKAGIPESLLSNVPILGKAAKLPMRPPRPVNPRLKPFLKPPVFGLEMFQVLRDSKIALNIHADSSPRYASNMRLFETTGVGTCIITDWKENLPDLFEPDKEVVTYKTAEECIHKVTWLLAHTKEREEIARAGQARTLKEHTFAHRAVNLVKIINKWLHAK